MDDSNKIIGCFCKELYFAETFKDHFKIYESYIEQLGYDGACYTFLPKIQVENIPLVQPIFKATKNYPIKFLEHYGREQLHNHDFTIRKGKEDCSLNPMDWREHELSGTLTNDEIGLIKLAREEYRITNAFTIPTQVSDVILAGATVVSFMSDSKFKNLKKENIKTLDIITKIFHDKSFASASLVHIFSEPLINKLTSTDFKALQLLVDGVPTKKLADHMNVGEAYSKDIVCNLCKKLGGINRDQLFFLLGRINLLQVN